MHGETAKFDNLFPNF